MKNVYKEVEEVSSIITEIESMKDDILDNYKINPKKCKKLLKELLEIEEDVKSLEEDYNNLLKTLE